MSNTTTPDEKKKRKRPPSQSSTLVALALRAGCELWHTGDGDPYATIPVGAHQEHWPGNRSRPGGVFLLN
jgi:hypothetical protein